MFVCLFVFALLYLCFALVGLDWLVWFSLVWFDLDWFGLVWIGLVCVSVFGLVWSGLVFVCYCLFFLRLTVLASLTGIIS